MYLGSAYASSGRGPARPRPHRRPVTVGSLLLACAVLTGPAALAPSPALADTGSSLTVVGTSDVSDSGLVQNLIQPEFTSAYPQFSFKYVGSATGAAIQSAEGTGTTSGPSVLIVHAASLENQFVANGFSNDNAYGSAIFRNDFVLAGPTGDPAQVAPAGAHDVARAFASVAAAGAAGRARFITRGGTTTASGTTVEEHSIWSLVASAHEIPAGVSLCVVSAADGGGMSPISPSVQAGSGQPCPDNGSVNSTDAPAWYVINTGANQAANVQAANAGSEYVLTDRGTFDYLSADQLQGGASLIPNLAIVTRDDATSAPGGTGALINYFHAYVINPNKPGESVNLTAAQDFVAFLTSASFQGRLSGYLANTGDAGGPPFVADASPLLTETGLLPRLARGRRVRVSGTVTNAELGYPALAGQPVDVEQVIGGTPLVIASTRTDATGAYSVAFIPPSAGQYQVSTPQLSVVENAALSPVYGDLLAPAATPPVSVTLVDPRVAHRLGIAVAHHGRVVRVRGRLSPAPATGGTRIELLATRAGSHGTRVLSTLALAGGRRSFTLRGRLPGAGRWTLRLRYRQPGQATVTSAARNVTVR